MLVRTPLMQAEQDGSIRVHDLAKVVMTRRRLGLAEERLVPPIAVLNVAYADDRPYAFHRISAVGLTSQFSGGALTFVLLQFIHHGPLQRVVSRLLRKIRIHVCQTCADLLARDHFVAAGSDERTETERPMIHIEFA
jgi:hypothetical protein